MKNIFKILLGLFLVLTAISCSNDEATEILLEQTQDVVFDINNYMPSDLSSKGLFSAKDNGDSPNDELVPNCVDKDPSYVKVTIFAPDQSTITYTLKLVTLANKTETEVMKLPLGTYKITEFVVYAADDSVLWASPLEGSYYEVLWDLKGVELEFTVQEFYKSRIEIDVLCYRPYQYELFGYAWFKYAAIEIHTICFFGDICTKFFEEWHTYRGERFNAYSEQQYEGYDFPAIFYVNVKNEEGIIVNDNRNIDGVYANSNLSWLGTGSPLCIEYPDQVGVDEAFTFEIMLKMPTGEWRLVYVSEPFTDTVISEIGNPDAFGGTDGIFDFVLGNCSYDDNDASLELLPWVPIPDTAVMDLIGVDGEQYLINVKFQQGTVMPEPIPDVIEEEEWYNVLCGEEFVPIYEGTYEVEFYSTMDRELPGTNFPTAYENYPWGSINYIANQCEENVALYGWDYIQEALWYVIDPNGTQRGVNNDLAIAAAANSEFIPTVGDYACVLIEPISRIRAIEGFQLLLLRVDP